jgi:hypothetical protein
VSPKYIFPDRVSGEPKLSSRDTKQLSRLVGKYGRDFIVGAAKSVPLPRKPGRPSEGILPFLKLAGLAYWIQNVAEKHRKSGKRNAIRLAEVELYEKTVDDEQRRTPDHFTRWQRNIKKKRLIGRRNLREMRNRRLTGRQMEGSLRGGALEEKRGRK